MDHMEQLCQSEQQKPQYQQLVLPIYQQQLFVSHGPKLGRSVQLKCKGFDQVDSHQSGDPNYHQISQNQQSFNGKTVHSQMQSMVSQEIKTEGLKVLVTEEARQKQSQEEILDYPGNQNQDLRLNLKNNQKNQKIYKNVKSAMLINPKNNSQPHQIANMTSVVIVSLNISLKTF